VSCCGQPRLVTWTRREGKWQAKLLGTAKRGDFLEVVEETGGGWLMVRLPGSSKLGFVEGSALERIRPQAVKPAPQVQERTAERPAAPAPLRAPRTKNPRAWEWATVMVSGGLTSGDVAASEARSFSLYQEDTGRLSTRYEFGSTAGLDLALRGQALSWLGLELALSTGGRDGSASIEAVVPHPLYFSQDRTLTHQIDGLELRARAIHASLVFTYRRGRLRGSVLGGMTFFSVTGQVLQQLEYTQAYPFDQDDVTIRSAPVVSLTDSPRAASFGASLDVTLHRHAGLGIMLRHASATAHLAREQRGSTQLPGILDPQTLYPSDTTPVALKVGGLRISAGARLYF
jgi:hypothetical protein